MKDHIKSVVAWTLMLLFFSPLLVGADTHNVANPGNGNDIRANLVNAISAASAGDTVQLPAGSFVLSQYVDIGKRIYLKGMGQDETNGGTLLYRDDSANLTDATLESWMYMIRLNNIPTSDGTTSGDGAVVSGIHFKSKTPSPDANRFIGGDGSSACDIGVWAFESTNFVITDCKFEYFGYAAIRVDHYDYTSQGLIRKNNFIHNIKMCPYAVSTGGTTMGYGVVVYSGQHAAWRGSTGIGTENMIYVEDNYFSKHRHAIAAGQGGTYCFRYNDVEDNLWGQAVDAHGAGAFGNDYSVRAFDIYQNTIKCNVDILGVALNTYPGSAPAGWDNYVTYALGSNYTFANNYYNKRLSEKAIAIRGGEGYVRDNTIGGFRFDVWIQIEQQAATPGYPANYPVPYQIGWKSGVDLGYGHTGYETSAKCAGDLFINGNLYNQVAVNNGGHYPSYGGSLYEYLLYSGDFLIEGRDYHLGVYPWYYTPGQSPSGTEFTYPHPRHLPGL
ncbi:MAG: hypothetical protein WCV67_19430 [Victivallaceae bacterium]|jgi:hypothetical protein